LQEESAFASVLTIIWAVVNIPGILLTVPIAILLSPGFVHADTFDGMVGFMICVGVPTFLSLVCNGLIGCVVSARKKRT